MEEYINILRNILSKKPLEVSPNHLDTYFEIISNNGYSKILNNPDIWEDSFETIEKSYQINRCHVADNPKMVTNFIKIISSIIAVKNKKKKEQLFPLIIYLDDTNIFYQHLITCSFFDEIKETILHILSSVNTTVNIKNISNSDWESELFSNYKNGIKRKNIKQIYTFILPFERGKGLIPNRVINLLVFVSYKIFYENLVKILNQQEDILTIISFINILVVEEKLKLAVSSTNSFLKFEALRETFHLEHSTYFCSVLSITEQGLIEKIVLDISTDNTLWSQFLEFYLKFPLRTPQLFKPLGLALSQLEYKKITPFINNIKIDSHISNECQSALNICFFSIQNKSIQKMISKGIFNRWLKLVNNYNDEYMDGILITNAIDIVIHYVANFLSEEKIIELISINIKNVQELDNKWFADERKQIHDFYKHMSELFIYGVATNTMSIRQQEELLPAIRASS